MKKAQTNQRIWIGGAAAIVLVAIVGLAFWQPWRANTQAATPTAAQSTQARRGDLEMSISGTGTLEAGSAVDLLFSASGEIAEVNVQVGDRVEAGEVLATLANIDELTQTVSERQATLEDAQEALELYQSSGEANIAQALADLAAAQETYAEAKANVHYKGDARCAKALTESYLYAYWEAQAKVDFWEPHLNNPNTGYGQDYVLQNLTPLRKARDLAYQNWKYCEGYTEQELLDSQAALKTAEANLALAEDTYQAVKDNNGIDPDTVARLQITVDDAQLQLTQAQLELEGATLTAPTEGTVTTLNGEAGDDAPSGVFITLSDLDHPVMTVYIDETDVLDFSVGCPASVVFDALPERTFIGEVTQIWPELVESDNVQVVKGLVELKGDLSYGDRSLPEGMSGVVDLVCSQAQDALVIPVDSLYTGDDGMSYVKVVDASGNTEERKVEIGLRTSTMASITAGLTEGEQVLLYP